MNSKRRFRKKVTPVILQMEVAECGAAALGIILAYYNFYEPLEKLRIECGVSRDGSKALNIVKAARKYRMKAAGIQIEDINELEKIDFPCILHWKFNHFLVLEKIVGNRVYINDPASGRRIIDKRELDENFTGVALFLEPSENFQGDKKPPSIVSGLKNRLSGCSSALLFVVLASLVLIIPGILIPGFIKVFIDDILINQRHHWLITLSFVMIIVLFFQFIFTWLQKRYLLRLQIHISLKTSAKFFWHVLQLPYSFFQQRFAGDINERSNANTRVSELVSGQFTGAVIGMISMLFYAAIMFLIDWQLTLIGVVVVGINFYLLLAISRKISNVSRSFLQIQGKLAGLEMNGLQMIETLKATASEHHFFQQWAGNHAKLLNEQQKIMIYNQVLSIIPGLFFSLLTVVILGFGSWKIMQGQLTVGTLIAFQALITNFSSPTMTLLSLGNQIQQAKGDISRLDDVLENSVDHRIHESQQVVSDATDLQGNVELKNIVFGYSPLEEPLLKKVNLSIEKGQHVAIVGKTGSGKSSLIKLLTGLYQPWQGHVLFDNKDMNKISRNDFSNYVSLVDQDIFIFSGNIADNLSLWDSKISDNQMIEALKQACLYDDLLPRGGLLAEVEEGGANFSGGQCQRLEIARALLTRPRVLLLDEATSALDPVTEIKIYQNLKKMNTTLIIIAHRLSAIRDCDTILVMDKGQIVEKGSHKTLAQLNKAYAKLISLE